MTIRTRPGHLLPPTLAAVLVLTACGSADDQPSAAPTGPASTAAAAPSTPAPPVTTAPPAPAFEAEQVGDLGQLCTANDRRNAGAAFYAGGGPHPIAVFAREVGSKGFERRYIPRDKPPGFDPEQAADVALLACVSGVKTGKTVGSCRYQTANGTRTVRVDGQRFTIDVYALDTGRRVARRTFTADFCPPTLLTTDGGNDLPSRMTATMNDEHLFNVLNRYVSGTAS